MNTKNARLYGAVAAAVVLAGAGGYALSSLQSRGPETAEEAHEDEGGHAEGEAAEEGVVALTPAQIQAAGIQMAEVARGGGGEVRLSGRVQPMIDARASVGASVAGRVERVLAAPGQQVGAGQPLVILVSGDAATFRADADAAAAAADAARRAYQRDARLGEQGIVATQDVEAAKAQALSAEAAARAARARASAAGSPNASGRVSVASPIAGVVTAVPVGPGGFVAQGGVVAEVTNPARLELVFSAPASAASSVRAGSAIRVQGPSGEFPAVVVGVAAGAGDQTGAAVIRARASGGLLPPAGAAVTGAITVGGDSGAMTVPTDAVQTVEGRSVVFVATGAGFRAVPVLVGRQSGDRTEIVRGLTGQERVAAANAFLLKAELAKGEAEHGH